MGAEAFSVTLTPVPWRRSTWPARASVPLKATRTCMASSSEGFVFKAAGSEGLSARLSKPRRARTVLSGDSSGPSSRAMTTHSVGSGGREEAQPEAGALQGGWREFVLALLGSIAATVLMTYPLAFHPGSLGRTDSFDGQFSIWNVAWVAHALVVDPLHVFDANIFHPHRWTLAY